MALAQVPGPGPAPALAPGPPGPAPLARPKMLFGVSRWCHFLDHVLSAFLVAKRSAKSGVGTLVNDYEPNSQYWTNA